MTGVAIAEAGLARGAVAPRVSSRQRIEAMSASSGTFFRIERLRGQEARGQDRQGGVLGAADRDLTGERAAAANEDTVHRVAEAPVGRRLRRARRLLYGLPPHRLKSSIRTGLFRLNGTGRLLLAAALLLLASCAYGSASASRAARAAFSAACAPIAAAAWARPARSRAVPMSLASDPAYGIDRSRGRSGRRRSSGVEHSLGKGGVGVFNSPRPPPAPGPSPGFLFGFLPPPLPASR